jgi:hypothetical protein
MRCPHGKVVLCRDARQIDSAAYRAVIAARRDRVAAVEGDEQRFERVAPVGPAAGHVQEQIELGRRRNSQRAHGRNCHRAGSACQRIRPRRGALRVPPIDNDAELNVGVGERSRFGVRVASSTYS